MAYDPFVILCKEKGLTEPQREYKFMLEGAGLDGWRKAAWIFGPSRRWRFDYAWPFERVALEVEGGVWTQGRHTRPRGFLGDIDKYNAATLMKWRVFRCTPDALQSVQVMEILAAALSVEQPLYQKG